MELNEYNLNRYKLSTKINNLDAISIDDITSERVINDINNIIDNIKFLDNTMADSRYVINNIDNNLVELINIFDTLDKLNKDYNDYIDMKVISDLLDNGESNIKDKDYILRVILRFLLTFVNYFKNRNITDVLVNEYYYLLSILWKDYDTDIYNIYLRLYNNMDI